jgi:RNA-directed DNA polymerase
MDDILVLAPTRWTLRTAVKVANQVLASLGLAKHPDKTFIGRIEKGFDWLGYHISRCGLRVATTILQHFVTRSLRLYEQELREGETSSRLGDYVRRWVRWVSAGVEPGTSAVTCLPGLGNRSQSLPPR